jgi:hypothetical protein
MLPKSAEELLDHDERRARKDGERGPTQSPKPWKLGQLARAPTFVVSFSFAGTAPG